MGTSTALQLDDVAFGKATGLRRGEDVVDALAYIDDITPDEQRIAENLIKEEVISKRDLWIPSAAPIRQDALLLKLKWQISILHICWGALACFSAKLVSADQGNVETTCRLPQGDAQASPSKIRGELRDPGLGDCQSARLHFFNPSLLRSRFL